MTLEKTYSAILSFVKQSKIACFFKSAVYNFCLNFKGVRMLNNIAILIVAQAEASSQSGAGGAAGSMIIMFVLLFVVMYFFMIRPQSKKQKALTAMRDGMKKNDKVMTTGGIIGFVHKIKENEIVLKIDEKNDVKITVVRGAVVHTLEVTPEDAKAIKNADNDNADNDNDEDTNDEKE